MSGPLKQITPADRPVLARLFQYYLHDMSQFAGWPVAANGAFEYPTDLLTPYWSAPDHHPYFILQDDEIAGFCLVRVAPDESKLWDMGQFFVLRKFRGTGLGLHAFQHTLDTYPGRWQVRVRTDNAPACRFWKRGIDDMARGEVRVVTKPYGDIDMLFFTFEAGVHERNM